MKSEDIPFTIGSFSLDADAVIPMAIVFGIAFLMLIGAKKELATLAIGAIVIGAILAN